MSGFPQPVGMTLIGKNLLTAAAANLSFASISGGFSHLRLMIEAASATVAESDSAAIQFNGDTGGNYDKQGALVSGVSAPANLESVAQSSITLASIAAASATAGSSSLLIVDILNYTGTTFRKMLKIMGGYIDVQTATTDAEFRAATALWRSTAAITSITLVTSSAANFVAGSGAWLYGIP